MKTRSSSSLHGSRRGVALIITLFFLVLISMISIGYITTARLDRTAAGSHFERLRAESFANDGLARVVSTLQRETGDPPLKAKDKAYYPRNWVSQPGFIAVTDGTTELDRTRLVKTVPLFSGEPSEPYKTNATNIPLNMRSAELNIDLLSDQRVAATTNNANSRTIVPHLLTDQLNKSGEPLSMKVRWVYVRRSGEYVFSGNLANGDDQIVFDEDPDTTRRDDPIVGRFAYWTDDESTKVNYNLAWLRDSSVNRNLPGSQTNIDLRGIGSSSTNASERFTPGLANSIHRFITMDNYSTVNRFFNSPLDARQLKDEAARQALDMNKFSLTHYNADPDTTYYGRPRMMLTTQRSRAVVRDAEGNPTKVFRPFLDILKYNGNSLAYVDPGTTGVDATNGKVDPDKLTVCVKDLVDNYLKRIDWPMVDGNNHSLQEKYYGTYSGTARDQRLAQIALNIIEYVRSAESSRMVVEPIRAKWIGEKFTPDFVDTSIRGKDDTFKGLARGPHITEIGMWLAETPDLTPPTANKYRGYLFIEVHLPLNYGLDKIDFRKQQLDLRNPNGTATWSVYAKAINGGNYFARNGAAFQGPNDEFTIGQYDPAVARPFIWESRNETPAQYASPNSMAVLPAGQYRTIAFEFWRTTRRQPGERLGLRTALTLQGGPRIDVVPLGQSPNDTTGQLSIPIDGGAGVIAPTPLNSPSRISYGTMGSIETRDPRVNGLQFAGNKAEGKDWVLGPNSFGLVNNATVAVLNGGTSVTPPQDLDKDGKVTDISMRMPAPYGTTSNPTGVVRSVGELGLIHTGIEGSSSAPSPGIPFRSLHLQPSRQTTQVVPDWAFMDLFTVPTEVPQAAFGLFAPRGSSTGGRVNMNAKPAPFSDLERVDPLTAVLLKARRTTGGALVEENDSASAPGAKTIARNIYEHVIATPKGTLPGGKHYPALNPQRPLLYESPGEVVEIDGVADRGEESEELVREISNLITARGNVFSVYTIGQALKQTPNGKLVVTAEQRQQHFVERYLIDKRTPELEDDEVRIRVAFSRNLTP